MPARCGGVRTWSRNESAVWAGSPEISSGRLTSRVRAWVRARGAAALVSLTLPALLPAQSRPGETPTIRAVVLERNPVFDSTEARFWGFRLLNALHAETKPSVIRRELLFAPGERYDTARVHESERNLRALGIFRDVSLDTVRTDSGLVVRVRTQDAWTTTVGVGLSTQGSQFVLDLSLRELNLLGRRVISLLEYRNDPDRSAIVAGVDVPRVLYDRVGFGATVVDQSDGRAGAVSVRYPFVSLSSRAGAAIGAQHFDGRVLRYALGSPVPFDSLRRRFELVRGEAAVALTASSRGFVHVGLSGQVRREDFGPEEAPALVPRTVTATVGPYVALRFPRYIRVRDVQYLDRVEDVDVGVGLQADVLLAPRAWGYERDGVGLSLGVAAGHEVPRGFARYTARASALQERGGGTDSSTVEGTATVYVRPGAGQLVAAHASAGMLRRPYPGGEYDIGLGRALRAFPAHSFTGDRYYQLAAEYRYIVLPRVFGLLGVGVAGFVDHAGAWYHGDPRRTGTNVGAGLRIASLREAQAAIWRLDVSRRLATDRQPAGWVVSVGQGWVFRRG